MQFHVKWTDRYSYKCSRINITLKLYSHVATTINLLTSPQEEVLMENTWQFWHWIWRKIHFLRLLQEGSVWRAFGGCAILFTAFLLSFLIIFLLFCNAYKLFVLWRYMQGDIYSSKKVSFIPWTQRHQFIVWCYNNRPVLFNTLTNAVQRVKYN